MNAYINLSYTKQKQTLPFNIIAFLIVVYPLLFIRQGLDFTDMGYWLSNYNLIFTHPHQVVSGFSCYLSEIIGGVWLFLFGWAGVIGIKLGYVAVLYITIFCVYQVLKGFFNKTHVALMLFLALVFITKSSGNWISYNNLTALFYVLSGLFLYRSINDRSRASCFIAGFVIAACVFVRLPNILAVFLLLLPVYYDLRIKNRSINWSDYGFRGLGFLSGLAGVSGLMLLCGHLKIFINSLAGILNVAASSESLYSGAHLFDMFTNDHIATFKIGGVILLLYLTGILIFSLFRFINNNILKALFGITAGSLCYYYTPALEPVFKNWFEFRIFEFTGVLYILLIIFFLWSIFRQDREKEEFLILLSILILLMVPLGSGNGIRNSVYGMWFAIPVAGCFLFRIDNIRIANIAAVTIILIYSVTTAWQYTYRDSPERMKMTCSVEHPKLRGVLTTERRAEAVQQLLNVMPEYVKKGDFLFAVENIPLLYYLTDTLPYISNSWPLIYSDDEFKAALKKAEKKMDSMPIIVKAKVNTRSFSWPQKSAYFGVPFRYRLRNKRQMLSDFVVKFNYKKAWESNFFEIWKPCSDAFAENEKFYKYNYDLSDYEKMCSRLDGHEYNISFTNSELKSADNIRKGLKQLPYLTLQGIRGDFSAAVINDGEADVLRVKLDQSDRLSNQKKNIRKVIQFGPSKGKKRFDFDTDNAGICCLFVRARVKPPGKLQIFIQEKKNSSWHRIRTEKKYSNEGWHDYVVFKKISANISRMSCGIYWSPKSEDSVLDILNIKCFVTL
ncbi:MAG: hypothetical protein GWP10_17750 [Nitrospiraceae bacterium]|nr:hypothetical protein [Nitrospiraceae bacterium]